MSKHFNVPFLILGPSGLSSWWPIQTKRHAYRIVLCCTDKTNNRV